VGLFEKKRGNKGISALKKFVEDLAFALWGNETGV